MKIKKKTEDIYTSRENENLRATVARQTATIDYIAMMADVEIPMEEENAEMGGFDYE